MNRPTCETANSNTGYLRLCENDFAADTGYVLVPKGTEIATETAALTESTWTNLFKAVPASRAYPIPLASTMTDQTQEDKVFDSPYRGKKTISEGKEGIMIEVDIPLSVHKKLRSFNNKKWDCYRIDENGYIKGYTKDNVKFLPFTLQEFHVGKMKQATDTTPALTPITLIFADPSQWNDKGAAVKPTAFSPLDFDGLYDVEVIASGATVAGLNVAVYMIDRASTDSEAQIIGLEKEDFVILDDAGGSETISSLTDNGDGTYHLAATLAADTYTVDLVAPLSISLTLPGIESTGPDTFTVTS